MPAIGTCMLPQPLKMLREEYNNLNIIVHLKGRSELQQAVAERRYDIGLATLPIVQQGLTVEPLCTVRSVIIMPNNHRLAAKSVVHAEDLEGESLVSLSTDTVMRYRTRSIASRRSRQSTILLGNLVKIGLGIAVAHPFVADHFRGQLQIRPFEPAIDISYGLTFAEGARRLRVTDRFQ